MSSLEKLGAYLESFSTNDPNYDYVCYIKEKLANINNMPGIDDETGMHEEENNESQEFETSEFDKTKQNIEGHLMDGAFRDLDVLNQLDKEKEQETFDSSQQQPN